MSSKKYICSCCESTSFSINEDKIRCLACNSTSFIISEDNYYFYKGVKYRDEGKFISVVGFTNEIEKCTKLLSEISDKKVLIIDDSAFYGCKNMQKIIIPKTISEIRSSAFEGCDNLTIFCDFVFQPSSWYMTWNYDDRPVYWTNEWSVVDGEPTINI